MCGKLKQLTLEIIDRCLKGCCELYRRDIDLALRKVDCRVDCTESDFIPRNHVLNWIGASLDIYIYMRKGGEKIAKLMSRAASANIYPI